MGKIRMVIIPSPGESLHCGKASYSFEFCCERVQHEINTGKDAGSRTMLFFIYSVSHVPSHFTHIISITLYLTFQLIVLYFPLCASQFEEDHCSYIRWEAGGHLWIWRGKASTAALHSTSRIKYRNEHFSFYTQSLCVCVCVCRWEKAAVLL